MTGSPLAGIVPVDSGRRETSVLIVDDDRELADRSAAFLGRELDGAETTTVTDPTEALETLTAGAYDCVVSDFEMPEMDGLELLDALRAAGVDRPFVLFTETGSEEIASRAISAGADEYLQKGGTEELSRLANAVENLVERHRAKAQVRRAFHAIESAEEGIGIVDEDGTYRYVNDAYAAVYDRDRSDLIGARWERLYPPEETRRFYEEILPRLRRRGTWRGRAVGLARDGTPVEERLVLTQMDDGGHVCIVRTVDRREERLRATTARLEAVFENSPDMIVIHDADGVVRDVNHRACEVLGYEESELVGMRVWDLDATTDPEEAKSFWAELPSNTRRRFEGEFRRRDGSAFPVEIHLVRLDLDGADRFVAISRDIGEQRARERELAGQNDRLDRFASVVSHDLRNPLTVAKGRLAMLEGEVESEHVPPIRRALDRMDALVEDLLTLARQGDDALDPSRLDLDELVTDCWEMVDADDATVAVETGGAVEADEERLRQLFENLLHNAVEHGGDGVAVTVGRLDGADGRDGFYVEDDGPGIPPSDRDEVFEAGHSTAEGGTGYGLNIVRTVAEAHGWNVSVTEGTAGGARFEVDSVAWLGE